MSYYGDYREEMMTVSELRDRFAMAALQGMLAEPQNPHYHSVECDWVRTLTARAYEYADAMMEARKK